MSSLLHHLDTRNRFGPGCRTCQYLAHRDSDPDLCEFIREYTRRKRAKTTGLSFVAAAEIMTENGFPITEGAIRAHVRGGHE